MWQQRAVFLRPLGVGERIDAAIKIVRRSLLTFMKAAVVVAVPAAIIGGAISLSIFSTLANTQTIVNANGSVTVQNLNSSLETVFAGFAALEFVLLIAAALIAAIAVRVVADAYLGHPSNWRQALAYGARRFGSVLWIQLLILITIAVPGAIVGVVLGLVSSLGSAGALLAVVLGIVAVLALVWFWTAASLAIPVLMTEDIRGWKAIRRSVALCRKHWWSVFGTLLLAYLLLAIGTTILRLLIDFVLGLFGGGDVVLALEGAVVSLLTTMLFVSFIAAVQVVTAIDMRVRKEGFDIQLLAQQMGTAPTTSAMSFLSPPGGPGWGYGGYPAPGGYPPPPGGGPTYPSPPGYGYPPPPGYGYPPQGTAPPPGGAPPQRGWESVAPGWSEGWSNPAPPAPYPTSQPPGTAEVPGAPQYPPPPWNQQPPAYPPPYGQPQAPPGPFPSPTGERPLPPFRPRGDGPPAAAPPEPGAGGSGEVPTDPLGPQQPPSADPDEHHED